MSRSKKMNMVATDIAIFSFVKDSQKRDLNSKSYNYVFDIFEKLMIREGVKSDKIGFGGYITDMAFYLAALIEVYNMADVHIEMDIDNYSPIDFDPDSVPNKI